MKCAHGGWALGFKRKSTGRVVKDAKKAEENIASSICSFVRSSCNRRDKYHPIECNISKYLSIKILHLNIQNIGVILVEDVEYY